MGMDERKVTPGAVDEFDGRDRASSRGELYEGEGCGREGYSAANKEAANKTSTLVGGVGRNEGELSPKRRAS